MIVGFVGSGSMATAIARGWAGAFELMLFSDAGSGRARSLAEELGGEAVSNAEIAERADLVVLAVKPALLEQVAPEISAAPRVVSILAAVSLAQVSAALPGAEVLRLMPNVGVEVRSGVLCIAGQASDGVRQKLAVLGHVVEIADAGLDPELARELVVETTAGTAELLRVRQPADVRRAVASPGGSTEAGLEALEREGARHAFEAAVEASLERMRG